jgi:hypothetical protein
MSFSMQGIDANAQFKIVAVALMAASVVVWVGITAHVPSAPTENSITAPVRPWTVPGQPSPIAMAKIIASNEIKTRAPRMSPTTFVDQKTEMSVRTEGVRIGGAAIMS